MTADARDYATSMLVAEERAVADSIEVVRLKPFGDHVLVAARFRDRSDRHRRTIFGLREMNGTWHGTGGFGSNQPAPGTVNAAWYSGGWSHSISGRQRTVRGFWIALPDARSLRLTDAADRIQVDGIENGVALLSWDDEVALRMARVELHDAEGNVLRSGPIWPPPPLWD